MNEFSSLFRLILPLLLFALGTQAPLLAQNKTLTAVKGRVLDAKTKEALPYATVQFDDAPTGVRTDIDGNFYIERKGPAQKIRVSYVGYPTTLLAIRSGEYNEVTVNLEENSVNIKEVMVKPEKYRRKNNPAVDLIEEVFKHKDLNRKEGLDYFSYEKYEKLQFDLNNITDQFRKKWYLKKFQVIFDHVDTNKVNGKISMPFYLRERLMQVCYRKDPKAVREFLIAEQQTSLDKNYDVDQAGISEYLSTMYQDVDIYEPTIFLLNNQFIGPLSGAATAFYRFYIVDTVELGGERFADVFFSPKNKNDLAFMGNMLVALDSTYAVRRVEMGISKEINMNWVSDLHIEQEFDFYGEGANRRLMLIQDAITMDFSVLKKAEGRSMLARKTCSYRNYALNKPLADTLFAGPDRLIRDTAGAYTHDTAFWRAHRHIPLSFREEQIGQVVDSIQRVPIFRHTLNAITIFGTGFYKTGWFEWGMVGTFLSYNDIEGLRLKVGGRTNLKFSENLVLEGYVAYGTRDKAWKYMGSVTYAFKGHRARMFPMKQFTLSFQQDLRIPGVDFQFVSQDNIFLSVQRSASNRMLLNRITKMEYMREYRNGLSYSTGFQRREMSAAGALTLDAEKVNGDGLQPLGILTTSEFNFMLRYAPDEKFYQGPTYRYPMLNRNPVFNLGYKLGVKGILGGEYQYHKLTARARKTFFVAPFGHSEITLEAGKTWGAVPYPLLEIFRGNQSYSFDWYAYNLMNFMEFAGDQYGSLMWHHNLNGFVLNKVPLLRKLQWREVFSFKCLYSALSRNNQPGADNGLPVFPIDAEGAQLARSLTYGKPYMEFSAGVSNIFRVLRVDYVQRLHYNDFPGVSKWGVRLGIQMGF